jgi:hypothetical protein
MLIELLLGVCSTIVMVPSRCPAGDGDLDVPAVRQIFGALGPLGERVVPA